MSLILDPSEVSDEGRVELNLWDGPIYVRSEGIDWGDTAIELFKSQQIYGESVIDYRLPPREVVAPLVIREDALTGTTMMEAMQNLQAKVARMAIEGGTLKRVRDGLDLYADVIEASCVIPDSWTGENQDFEAEGQIRLLCMPDFYGDEEVIPLNDTSGGFGSNVLNNIEGNYPARTRIICLDKSSANHRGVMYGFRSRNYSADSTARLMYEAEALQPLGGATVVTVSGASGGVSNNAVEQSLGTAWSPMLGTKIGGGAGQHMTHVGTYRVYARVTVTQSTGDVFAGTSVLPNFRFIWAEGDLTSYEENDPKTITGFKGWYILDLGEVRLSKPTQGTPRWQGIVQAKVDTVGLIADKVAIDRLILCPKDESSGMVIQEPSSYINTNGFSIQDPFNQSAGNMVGKISVPSGSPYSALIAGGSDFTNTGTLVRRSATGANGVLRAVGLPLAISDTSVLVNVSFSAFVGSDLAGGVIVRGVDSSNFLEVTVRPIAGNIVVDKVVAGVRTTIASRAYPGYNPGSSVLLGVSVIDNRVNVSWNLTPLFEVQDGDLTGVLNSGGVYLADRHTSASACNRDYDNLTVWTNITTAALFSGRRLEIGTRGVLREASDGGGWGYIAPYGDMPRIPVSGREGRSVELMLATSRGNFDDLTDYSLDSVGLSLAYRPCWSSVPE